MNKKKTVLVVLLLLTALFCTIVHADAAPTGTLTVYVENPPDEPYYLDLLYEPAGKEILPNLTEEMLSSVPSAVLQAIRENRFGLTAVLVDGTESSAFGSLTGEVQGMRMKHTFRGSGLPQTYRIIIVTESGGVRVSEPYTRQALQSSITYDFSTGMAQIPALWMQYAIQFLWTFAVTVLLEGGLLLLFRLPFGKNVLRFFAVNLAAELLLTTIVGTTLIQAGTGSAFWALFVCELIITAAETAAYSLLLQGGSRVRRIAYGVSANLASWAVGALSLELLYSWITVAA